MKFQEQNQLQSQIARGIVHVPQYGSKAHWIDQTATVANAQVGLILKLIGIPSDLLAHRVYAIGTFDGATEVFSGRLVFKFNQSVALEFPCKIGQPGFSAIQYPSATQALDANAMAFSNTTTSERNARPMDVICAFDTIELHSDLATLGGTRTVGIACYSQIGGPV